MNKNILLGVNIDHVATLRQTRLTRYPEPLAAVVAAELGGADGITVHLREDRRHIQERDVLLIKEMLLTRLNLEIAVTDAMVSFAEKIKPAYCCFVPEKREELTTEGGLDIIKHEARIRDACLKLQALGINVSLFINPDLHHIEAANRVGAKYIEIHTGCYADAKSPEAESLELRRIIEAAQFADSLKLIVNAGHGLNYQNVKAIAAIPQIYELNIGHSIVSHALFVGFEKAVFEMKKLMMEARV